MNTTHAHVNTISDLIRPLTRDQMRTFGPGAVISLRKRQLHMAQRLEQSYRTAGQLEAAISHGLESVVIAAEIAAIREECNAETDRTVKGG